MTPQERLAELIGRIERGEVDGPEAFKTIMDFTNKNLNDHDHFMFLCFTVGYLTASVTANAAAGVARQLLSRLPQDKD